ncbi:choline/ethanolamine kinase family protein [Roseibium sp. FZY0029]|uniref:choline/ethanolamine kinase family protein n=1 Tax=Roseibium sp. FZY0029 TaxID=3116647 RepID=UPI002ED68E9D
MPQLSSDAPDATLPAILETFETHHHLHEVCGAPLTAMAFPGLTNRVFKLHAEKGTFFLRLPRREAAGSIDRKAEARNLTLAADAGLAVPPVFCDPCTGVLVTRAVEVHTEAAHRGQPPQALAEALGEVLGRLHGSGAAFEGRLDPDCVLEAQWHGLRNMSDLHSEMDGLEKVLKLRAASMSGSAGLGYVPSHGDPSPGNCLMTDERLWLIDWEFSAMSDPAWDLAYAVLEHQMRPDQEDVFLQAYAATGADLPDAARLGVMKAKCDTVSALWALEQVAAGRDEAVFLPFARQRRQRALQQLAVLT